MFRLLHITSAGALRKPRFLAVCSNSDLASSVRACPFPLSLLTHSRNICHIFSPFAPSLSSPAVSLATRKLPNEKSRLRRVPNLQTATRVPKSQPGSNNAVKT